MSFIAPLRSLLSKLTLLITIFRFCSISTILKSIIILTGMSELPPPFVNIQGVFNIRRVGGYITNNPNSKKTKPALLYRSGDPSRITVRGKQVLLDLGVTTIFDLRTDVEGGVKASFIRTTPDDPPLWSTVKRVAVPIADAQWASPRNEQHADNETDAAKNEMKLVNFLKGFEVDEMGAFRKTYTNILEMGTGAYRPIFEHLRDKPEEKILIHCTAGKDRTGLFIALFLMLLDVPDQDIIDDYALTTVGLEPLVPVLFARFQKIKAYRENLTGVGNMGSSRPETMQMALRLIRELYGDTRGYLVNRVGMSHEDVEKIRSNYLV